MSTVYLLAALYVLAAESHTLHGLLQVFHSLIRIFRAGFVYDSVAFLVVVPMFISRIVPVAAALTPQPLDDPCGIPRGARIRRLYRSLDVRRIKAHVLQATPQRRLTFFSYEWPPCRRGRSPPLPCGISVHICLPESAEERRPGADDVKSYPRVARPPQPRRLGRPRRRHGQVVVVGCVESSPQRAGIFPPGRRRAGPCCRHGRVVVLVIRRGRGRLARRGTGIPIYPV
mmetsp:Transcript_6997/g.17351  ORF Transcript_6997/g.17351 Transcript_6997/m.17351 type:complete len:229 (-) Transcript_6997:194-880(-)